MRTTTGPVPAERTKMSAPAGLWTIWDLKVEGSAGCAVAICLETTAREIASRMLPVIFEPSPIDRVLPVPLLNCVPIVYHNTACCRWTCCSGARNDCDHAGFSGGDFSVDRK